MNTLLTAITSTVKSLYAKGLRQHEIASQLGISQPRVSKILSDAEVKCHKGNRIDRDPAPRVKERMASQLGSRGLNLSSVI